MITFLASYIFRRFSKSFLVVHRQMVAREIPVFLANWAGVNVFVPFMIQM